MIQVSNISHSYGNEEVLHDISFDIKEGEFIFLSGDSGSGKSTLLSIISTLLKPSSGELIFNNEKVEEISNIDIFRQKNIGFVFQFHYLINYLNIYENIALATYDEKEKNIDKLLEKLGISELALRYPDEISGGQRQRVALARALINEPKIIFCDEPTGSLDSKNSKKVYELLDEACQNNTTIIVASHDLHVENYATRILRIEDGKIQ